MEVYLGLATNWMRMKWNAFTKEEHGAGEIIAVVVILAIVIALGIIFQEAIGQLFADLWGRITGSVPEVGNVPS